MSAAGRRLLLIKFGAIGDCVMAIPAAHQMYLAGWQVDWVCGRSVAPVLALYPWLNVIAVDERALLGGSRTQTAKALLGFWRLVGARSYDASATLYYDARYKLLALPVRAARKLMLSKGDRERTLLPGRHHTDEYARLLLGLAGISYAESETPTQLAPVPAPGLPPAPLAPSTKARVVLVPGGARNVLRDDALRRWPVENYVALAEALLERGHEVVLSGGPEDGWVSEHFAHLADSSLPLHDLTGQLTLVESLALYESAAVTVTHDTGPLHLAGLTQTAILTLFGPTDPYGRLPQRGNALAIWGGEGFSCRPCYDGRDYAACAHNGCIRQISPALAVKWVERLLQAVRDGDAMMPRVLAPSAAEALA